MPRRNAPRPAARLPVRHRLFYHGNFPSRRPGNSVNLALLMELGVACVRRAVLRAALCACGSLLI